MANVPTTMRVAFENARHGDSRPLSMRSRTQIERSVSSALRRGVGLVHRKQWWSVNRGSR